MPKIHGSPLLCDALACVVGIPTQVFVEQGYQDVGNARQQAARGTYDPAYLNYTLGKLMILKLRRNWLEANPGKTLKQFNDEFLSYGGPPIPLVRVQMLRGQAGELF